MRVLPKEDLDEVSQRGRGRPRDEYARQRILESALALVEEVGFVNATTDAIAERAGASKSTIYRWWSNKAAVVIEALEDQVSHEQPFPNTGNLRRDIHQQLQNFIGFLTGRRGRLFMAFIAAAQSDPEVAEAFRELWIKPRRRNARHVLERYQQEGSIPRNVDLNTALDLIYGPVYFRLLAGHGPLTPEFGRMIADLALNGLLECK
jgi:AcrR family transcriptional regulator